MRLAQHLNPTNIPQSQPLNNRQIRNDAGGFAFEASEWDQFLRFLILGTYGGTYYVSEQKATKRSVDALDKCLKHPKQYADMIVSVSDGGRAAKNDFAIFALAYGVAYTKQEDRRILLEILPKVCRIPTHLFMFVAAYKELGGGFSRSVRRALSEWYLAKTPDMLAEQVVKYRNREGWSHKDVLRLCHPKSQVHQNVFNWVVKGWNSEIAYPEAINLYEILKKANSKYACQVIKANPLVTREYLPTELLADPAVLEALTYSAPVTATIRNLANLSRVLGLTSHGYPEIVQVVEKRITNPDILKKGRVHPLFVLTALMQYAAGFSNTTGNGWQVNNHLVGALEEAFPLTLKNVEPLGISIMQAVDISGSMGVPATSNISCSEAAAAMAMVVSQVEKEVLNVSFDTRVVNPNVRLGKKASVSHAVKAFGTGGSTDLAASIRFAIDKKLKFDLIIIYTDNETWAGRRHLAIEWDLYKKINPKAKLVIASTQANQVTVGDPQDPSVLQVVGFDTNLLDVIYGWYK
jgi:60 kDa SS-A/Ro ribonucleoprotein